MTSPQETQAPAPFVLPGWSEARTSRSEWDAVLYGDEQAPPTAVLPTQDSLRGRRERRRRHIFLTIFVIVLIAAAGVLGWLGFSQAGTVLDAPAPEKDFVVADGATRGELGHDPIETEAGPMTVEKMEPNSYFIPALGAYSKIVPTAEFGSTRYTNFKGLQIPKNPHKSAWYELGGALAQNQPGTEGTTLLASHVSYNGVWGALRELYTLKGGELIYVRDAQSQLSVWKMSEMKTMKHTEFPQEYWDVAGPRQLVLATCADYSPKLKGYAKNIFAIAVPVNPATLEPYGVTSD